MTERAFEASERLDFVWLELTPRCNLECTHCYADSGPWQPLEDGMRLADWLGVLDEASALGCRRVQFIGGEPTIYPGLAGLIAHARERDFEEVCVYTNGTHLTDELKTVFAEHRVGLAFSVYGSTAAVHDQVTRHHGSFAKTYDGILWAVAAGLSTRVAVIAMRSNEHDIASTMELLRTTGVGDVNVDRVRGVGRGLVERDAQSQLAELCGRCGNGKLCVGYRGEIFPCVFSRLWPLGHIKRSGLAATYASVHMAQFRLSAKAERERTSETDDGSPGTLTEWAASDCNPERPMPPCGPERPAPICTPEKDPGKCTPEKPTGPCAPEIAISSGALSVGALHVTSPGA